MNKIINDCPFHIGKMISDFITNNSISMESAAEKAKIDINEFRNILDMQSIDTETLKNISIALNHNFMSEIADIVGNELGSC